MNRIFPSKTAGDAVPTLKAFARASDAPRIVRGERRVPFQNSVWIDTHHKPIELRPGGWFVHEQRPEGVYFKRNDNDLPMPIPLTAAQRTGTLLQSVGKLAEIANLGKSSVLLVVALITHWFVFDTGNPIWVLSAEPGAGKSTAMGVLRDFAHPSRSAADNLPVKFSDVVALLAKSRFRVFDNIEGLNPETANAFCIVATEDGTVYITVRQMYTEHGTKGVAAGGVIALTTIGSVTLRGDVVSRMALIEIEKRDGAMLLKSEIEARQKEMQGEIFGALLDVAALAMAKVKEYGPEHEIRRLGGISRMASFDLWCCAVYSVVGLQERDALQMLQSMRSKSAIETIEGHPVLGLLMRLEHPIQGKTAEVSKELLKLRGWTWPEPPSGWPSAIALTKMLMREKGALERVGFKVTAKIDPKGNEPAKWLIEPRKG